MLNELIDDVVVCARRLTLERKLEHKYFSLAKRPVRLCIDFTPSRFRLDVDIR